LPSLKILDSSTGFVEEARSGMVSEVLLTRSDDVDDDDVGSAEYDGAVENASVEE